MARRLVGASRDSVLMRCTGKTPSSRDWATWEPAPPHPALTTNANGEMLKTTPGRWRMEVMEGKALTYLDEANRGNLAPGVYVWEGRLKIYNMSTTEPVVLVLTRLH